ncbi:MAG: type II secretion system F family protein [Candidatus Korobacteraceae bacterium]|jgi:tight adherence protein C
MLWTLTIITFLAIIGISAALLYAFTPAGVAVAGRLSRFLRPSEAAVADKAGFVEKHTGKVGGALVSFGKSLPANSGKESSSRLLVIRAGYRSPSAIFAVRAIKALLPFVFVAVVFVSGIYRGNPFMYLLMAAIAGYVLPELWLGWRVRARQHRLRKGLPDALDLLVICIEAGLGLDQALLRVSEELQLTHPELSDELQLVNLEMRLGKTRLESLRELARRTGLDDIKALVAMLIQTERFGTSVAQSLRVHADDLRVRRRQRAEEMGAKTSVKMVPPLVFFIFPALMVVILGPAVISLLRQLMPALK